MFTSIATSPVSETEVSDDEISASKDPAMPELKTISVPSISEAENAGFSLVPKLRLPLLTATLVCVSSFAVICSNTIVP